MDSALLKTFLILAKTRNFTQAALKLHRSQSAISLQILRLESQLGKTLFVRDNRNVYLTFEGEQLVKYASEILKLEEEMFFHFQKSHSLTGEVKFGTPEDIATSYLPSILANFVEAYPNIHLNVNCELTKHLIQGFQQVNYDLVLIKQDPQNPYPGSEVIWHEPLVWVANQDFSYSILEKKETLPLILAPSPCVYRQNAQDALFKAGIQSRVVYTSPSFTGIIAAVKAGLGVSVIPLKMVPGDLKILDNMPELLDAEIALLKQENCSEACTALSSYVSNHILLDTKA